jgi:hypothetical protein
VSGLAVQSSTAPYSTVQDRRAELMRVYIHKAPPCSHDKINTLVRRHRHQCCSSARLPQIRAPGGTAYSTVHAHCAPLVLYGTVPYACGAMPFMPFVLSCLSITQYSKPPSGASSQADPLHSLSFPHRTDNHPPPARPSQVHYSSTAHAGYMFVDI